MKPNRSSVTSPQRTLALSKKSPSRFRLFKRKLSRRVGTAVASWLVPPLLMMLRRTWKFRRLGEEQSACRPCLGAIFHGDMLVLATEFSWHLPNLDVLTSQSRDGDLVVPMIKAFGAGVIRGSSSRGQIEAMRGMRDAIRRKSTVVVAIDGPRGPYGIPKPGVIMTASRVGVPIVPAVVTADNVWQFKSWDRMFIPKPFSAVTVTYGEPIHVSPDADKDQIEEARLLLTQRLKEMKTLSPR